MGKEKLNKIIARISFVLSLTPVAVAGVLIFSHSNYSPWGAFLDPAIEFVMEYGWSWTYWLAIIFGIIAVGGVIIGFYLQKGWPPKSIWIMGIFTVLLALADVLLFFMIYEAGSTIGFINSMAAL